MLITPELRFACSGLFIFFYFIIIFHPFGGLTRKNLYATFVHFNIYIMKQIFLIGLMMLASLTIAGQTQNVDSLVNVLETGKLKPE